MTKLVQLNNSIHKNLKVNTTIVEQVGVNLRMIPVVLSEFLKLVVHYPIVISKNEETGAFVCAALLGFEQNENLFWQNNEWNAIYTPLQIQRQPFFIGKDAQNNSDEYVVCIDTDSKILSDKDDGTPLFKDSGEDAEYLTHIKQLLSELIQGELSTHNFIQTLLEHELLTPISLDITLENMEKLKLRGIYTIDKEKLNELPDNTFAKLRNDNYLDSIYTMLASLGHIYSLIHLKNQQISNTSVCCS